MNDYTKELNIFINANDMADNTIINVMKNLRDNAVFELTKTQISKIIDIFLLLTSEIKIILNIYGIDDESITKKDFIKTSKTPFDSSQSNQNEYEKLISKKSSDYENKKNRNNHDYNAEGAKDEEIID